jgi:hypothetical protein
VLEQLVGEESDEQRPGRGLVVTHLVEVMLIEALRSTPGDDAVPACCAGGRWPDRQPLHH